ncbi:MAG: hypothetical protein KGJ35_02630 [Patescibacteria group bacterium]|nr:hypothetical protein [Patescibacteria group bacterium]
MKKIILSLFSLATLSPLSAFAQTTIASAGINPLSISNATTLAQRLTYLFNVAIDVLIALAILWIIVSVVMWIVVGGENGAKHRTNALWGIAGLALVLSIWGLVHLLTNTFNTANNGLNAQEIPTVPQIQ